MKIKKNKGSVFLLVIIATAILSYMAIAGLTRTHTNLNATNSLKFTKNSFYLALRGLNQGANLIRNSMEPNGIVFDQSNFTDPPVKINHEFSNLPLWFSPTSDQNHQSVTLFDKFKIPHLPGVSLGSNSGMFTRAWHVFVSSRITISENSIARKELETAIVVLSPY